MSDTAQDTEPMEEVGILYFCFFALRLTHIYARKRHACDFGWHVLFSDVCRFVLSDPGLCLLLFPGFPFNFSTPPFFRLSVRVILLLLPTRSSRGAQTLVRRTAVFRACPCSMHIILCARVTRDSRCP